MDLKLFQKLKYSYAEEIETYPLLSPLKDSFQLISDFFSINPTNKLCLVFPSKEFTAQWLSVPFTLSIIKNDFANFKNQIFESYKQYKPGDKLILNNLEIVEWSGIKEDGVAFKTKGIRESSGAEITIKFSDVIMLQKAPANRKALSSLKSVKEALPLRNITPTEKLLGIDTYGNKEFIKNKICLISKYKSFEDSHEGILINHATLPEYFQVGRIDENGETNIESPLFISNNISNLALYITLSTSVSRIIIDGFSNIQERITDFLDIDTKNIPTILITDLSEMEYFEHIGNYGFEFFNFTKENLKLDHPAKNSPFHSLDKKLKKYITFHVVKEICKDPELENAIQKICSIEKDESNSDLTLAKNSLVQLINLVSRIAHDLNKGEISIFNSKLNNIEAMFLRAKMWIGNSHIPIKESLILIKSIIEKLALSPSEKCKRLKLLLSAKQYDYIICPSEDEARTMNDYISTSAFSHKPKVISVAQVNDNLLSDRPQKAILTGWAKSSNINRIFYSFLFSELTFLFYQFENRYFFSLQRRNRKYNRNIKATIDSNGARASSELVMPKGFDDLYSGNESIPAEAENLFDILEFELKLENAQFSRYIAKGNLIDSIKAKRLDFENDSFIYSTESHKFSVINELIESKIKTVNLFVKKIDAIKPGDIVALINTDRDILVELVEKNTNSMDLASVKQWTELWKSLLKKYYTSVGNDFKKLVNDLRKYDCKKHEVTIKTWLQDETKIGPEDDSDLISIALLTNSNLLIDNISKVREAIRKMTGWRMKASDFITEKIKAQIHKFADSSIINKKILIEGLGGVIFLKVIEISNVWENIDAGYVNKLLQKEII